MPTIMPPKIIAAQQARRRFGEFLDKADYRRESFLIERAGQAKAALVPVVEYNEMRRMKQEARGRLLALTEKIQERTSIYDPVEVQATIDEAVEAVRRENKTR